jgi:hypothetical protein
VRRSAIVAVAVVAFLAGCVAGGTGGAAPDASGSSPSAARASAASSSPGMTGSPSSSLAARAATPTPRHTATPEPSPGVPVTGVTIVNEGTSQFELWSPAGQRVLVDVVTPRRLTSPPTSADVLLTTHWHEDHYLRSFIDGFPGKALTVEDGALTAGDVRIRSVAAAHNEGDPFLKKDGTDYIFIVDIGGIRVAVFGDLGQDSLTSSQMKALGRVDVAISQLDNQVSDVTVANRKAIAQMEQVAPALLIPTHGSSADAAKLAAAAWPVVTGGQRVTIARDRLPKATTVLFIGDLAPAFRKILGITSPAW